LSVILNKKHHKSFFSGVKQLRISKRFTKAGVGTFLLSRAAWIVHYHWRAAKSINNSTFVYLWGRV